MAVNRGVVQLTVGRPNEFSRYRLLRGLWGRQANYQSQSQFRLGLTGLQKELR